MAAVAEVSTEVEQDTTDATANGEGDTVDGESQSDTAHSEEEKPAKRPKTVPLQEHISLRKRAQDAEAERDRLRIEAEVLRRQSPVAKPAPQVEPELTDDELWKSGGPAKYINQNRTEARKMAEDRANEAEFNARATLSEDLAEDKWPDYAAKKAYWFQNATMADVQQMRQAKNPAKFVYNWAKTKVEPAKSDEEREAEITASVIEKLRAKGVEIPEDEESETPKKKPTLKSIAGNRNAQGETTQVRNLTAVEAARKVQHRKF